MEKRLVLTPERLRCFNKMRGATIKVYLCLLYVSENGVVRIDGALKDGLCLEHGFPLNTLNNAITEMNRAGVIRKTGKGKTYEI